MVGVRSRRRFEQVAQARKAGAQPAAGLGTRLLAAEAGAGFDDRLYVSRRRPPSSKADRATPIDFAYAAH